MFTMFKKKSPASQNNASSVSAVQLDAHRQALKSIAAHVGTPYNEALHPETLAKAIIADIDRIVQGEANRPAPGSESRPISGTVRKIRIKGMVSTILRQGAKPELSVQCSDATMMSNVSTVVVGDTLVIDTEPTLVLTHQHGTMIFHGSIGSIAGGDIIVDGKTRVRRGQQSVLASPEMEVSVTLPDIADIEIEGSGSTTYTGFTQENLSVHLSGSGNLELQGEGHHLEAEISGSGELSAYDLQVTRADLRVSGSGAIRAAVLQSVRARVSGSGRIKIAGNPVERDARVTGSGKIKFVGRDTDVETY